jgi:hypothetical protein
MANGYSIFKGLNYDFCGMVSFICTCCFCIKTERKIVLEYEVWDDKKGSRIYILKYSDKKHRG